ncbi:Chorismate mutase 2, partial [Cucurbita argyrosperma subsp. sororia]
MLFLGLFVLILAKEAMADVNCNPDLASNKLSLDEIRDSLIRQEDTIVFCLIERAKFPLNPKLYHGNHGFTGSLVEFIVRETEAIQAKIHWLLAIWIWLTWLVVEVLHKGLERDSLMKLLTFEAVEEMVKKRVEKKARVFGQEVTLNNTVDGGKYKIDPFLAARLYDEWVMPLTKEVEVEYLLRRLE